MTKTTGWETGLSQDYDRKLGAWFADRLGSKQQLRDDVQQAMLDQINTGTGIYSQPTIKQPDD